MTRPESDKAARTQRFTSPSGKTYQVEARIAYQGQEGCQSVLCRVRPLPDGGWECIGWHCANCGKPSSYQGHYGKDGFSCDAA